MGRSPALASLLQVVDRVARSDCSVLVTGESGTGKELLVAALHDGSQRSTAPLVTVNCGALPEALMESELFGHARGAFTGAVCAREGRVAQAEGGTLFLDEIGELPLALQPKLLRLLQQREFTPVGADRTRVCDVRYVAATNRDLEEEVRRGAFREDLYFRLNVIPMHVPPLRERCDDIEELAQHFYGHALRDSGRDDLCGFDAAAISALRAYPWPGNIRELENVVQRTVLLAEGPDISAGDLPIDLLGEHEQLVEAIPESGINLRQLVGDYEEHLMKAALERTRWNKNQAAQLLGLNRTTLVEMIKRKKLRRIA